MNNLTRERIEEARDYLKPFAEENNDDYIKVVYANSAGMTPEELRADIEDNALRIRVNQASYAALEQALNPWQPIETAPKDGTEFLSRHKGEIYHTKWLTGNGCWGWRSHSLHKMNEIHTKLPVKYHGKEQTMPVVTKEGEHVFDHAWSIYQREFGCLEPDSWMPLQAPPKENK